MCVMKTRETWLMLRSLRRSWCCVPSPQSKSHTSARCGGLSATHETLRARVGTPALVPRKVIRKARPSSNSVVSGIAAFNPRSGCQRKAQGVSPGDAGGGRVAARVEAAREFRGAPHVDVHPSEHPFNINSVRGFYPRNHTKGHERMRGWF